MAVSSAGEPLINGRYRVVRKLGEGGMGIVHLVADTIDEEALLALKTIRADAVSPTRCRLFKNEFRAMTQFRHPNVVQVYDFGTVEGRRYAGQQFFTMEFVEGRNLLEACRGAELRTICGYGIQVCRALEYIHAQSFIHFDLKPENIMVSVDGSVKVMDFGVVGEQSFLQPRMLKGTANYIAPEMILGHQVDHRLDLYALGAVLFHVLTEQPLFGEASVQELLNHHVDAPPDLDGARARRLPAALRAVLQRLLAKDPADRYPTAGATLAALAPLASGGGPVVEGAPIARVGSGSWSLGSRFVGRKAELTSAQELFRQRVVKPRAGRPPLLLVSGPSGIGKSRLLSEVRHYVQLGETRFVHGSCLQKGGQPYLPFAEILRTLVREIIPSLGPSPEGEALPALDSPSETRARTGIFERMGDTNCLSTIIEVARVVDGASSRGLARDPATGSDRFVVPPLRPASVNVRVAGLLTEHAAALSRLVPEEAGLRDLGEPAPHFERPVHEKEWLIGSISRFLLELSRVRRLVLYASDLHWGDDLTVELLAHLATALREDETRPSGAEPARLLLCGCLRQDEVADSLLEKKLTELTRAGVAAVLPLAPLAASEVAVMLQHMLGAVEVTDEVSTWLFQRTAGNPFFVEETARSLFQDGIVFRRGPLWAFDVARVRSDREIPSLAAVLDRTLTDLDATEVRALELLAVFNRPVGGQLFAEADGDGQGPLSKVLLQLRRKRFVERGWADGHYQYGLRHAQLRDHVYARLDGDRRVELHGLAGSAIERVHGESDRYREDLAEHFFRAGNFERAIKHAQAAASQARSLFDLKRATVLYEQAYAAALRRGPTSEAQLLTADLAVTIAECSQYTPSEKNIERLVQALAVVEAAGDAGRAARIWNWKARTYYALGNQREAIRCSQEFIKLAEGTGGDLTAAAVPYGVLGRAYLFLGRFGAARQYLERAIAIARRHPGADVDLSHALGMCGSAMALLGDFADGLPLVEESIAIARAAQHTTRLAFGYVYLGIDQTWRGEWAEARQWLEQGIAITKQTGDVIGTGTGSSFLGLCHLVEGDTERALALSRFGRDQIRAAGGTWTFSMIGSHLVEALTWAGDFDGAQREADITLEVIDSGERWGESPLTVALGRLHACRGDRDQARRWFDRAIAVAEEQRARPFLAKARLALAAFLLDGDEADRPAAVEALHLARLAEEGFAAMGMAWYIARARTLLAGSRSLGPCP